MVDNEAIKEAYGLFTNDGYEGSITDFSTLISTDNEALDYAYELFTKDGYNGSVEHFGELMGKSKPGKTKTEEVKPKQAVNYQREMMIIDKAEQRVIDKIENNDKLSKEEKAAKLKKLNEFNAKKRNTIKSSVEDDYANELIAIANDQASEDLIKTWEEEAVTELSLIHI